MKRIFSLYFFTICFIGLLSFSPVPAGSLPDDVLTYTNKFRNSKGQPALIMRDDLNAIAQKHSADMASGRRRFGHDGFKERQKQAIRKIPSLQSFAENVAYGPVTGRDVVEMWKESAGHRSNMLGKFTYIGIGVATDRNGRIYYTQVFVN